MNKTLSQQFRLIKWDYVKGFIMAVLTPVLYFLQELIPGWNIDPILKIGASAGVAYLIKNFLEPTKIIGTNPTESEITSIKESRKKK